MITPSNESKNGGPMKADLTSHTGPTCLSMFHSAHYAGIDLCPQFRHGLVQFTYTSIKNPRGLQFVSFGMMQKLNYASSKRSTAGDAWVGLSLPGNVGTWQTESKGYQFWTKADSQGNFSIQNVRVGTYSLNAWVPSVIGDYLKNGHITVAAGDSISLGDLTYTPPRYGPTVWEIGYPSRTAAEFYIPDPDSRYPNLLYGSVEKWRNYGLWQRYTDLYPSQDLIYTIKFHLSTFDASQGAYKLRMAIAQAEIAAVQVRVNDIAMKPVYETPAFGKDNAIARHGIHGLYALYNIDIPAADLHKGDNIIYLTQRKASGPFNGFMYDYLRLESPPVSSSSS
ncbi:rhamnogalacturonan endolyase [Marchantia polymorpha subsp. ruderalis]|uniref:Rhamnogalacturonan endolyase n=2 Tax=Marchantia polymorpha TaxID=3197 RepID=A0AAF6BWF1_MARPO|nr:hypothetical protein MARPO_0504s0001 [Marchantia polymorpha]BBN16335.1 hypothetical protein Mp_7g05460 [Marchantia polymorpha subsp. ruderalis]|eukprot:PTQ26730.1 hypothetical protein MARPO_0504s0001 [Marchantia polymorpha]